MFDSIKICFLFAPEGQNVGKNTMSKITASRRAATVLVRKGGLHPYGMRLFFYIYSYRH